jgi:tetratricopeptide (TPR) repeat protein
MAKRSFEALIIFVLCACPTDGQHTETLHIFFELPPTDDLAFDQKTIIKKCSDFLRTRDKEKPDSVSKALRARGIAYSHQQKHLEAEKDFAELCKLKPHDFEAHYLRATTLAFLNRWDDSIVEANAVIKANPESSVGYLALAAALLGKGEENASFRLLNKVISIDGKSSQGYFLRAMVYYRHGKRSECLEDLNKVLELAPYRVDLSDAPYYYRGLTLADLNRPQEALASMLMARKLNPSSARVAQGLAEVYAQSGKFSVAAHYAEEVIRLDPNSPKGYGLAGEYYARAGRIPRAMQAVNKLLTYLDKDPTRYSPKDQIIYSTAGRIYFAIGKFSQASQLLTRALHMNPDDYWSLFSKASFLATCPDAKFRDGAEAVRLASKALQNSGLPAWGKWAPTMVLAEAHAEAGNFKEAARLAKEALEIAGPRFERRGEFLDKLSLFQKRMPYRAKIVHAKD